jgi:hypothetical protein
MTPAALAGLLRGRRSFDARVRLLRAAGAHAPSAGVDASRFLRGHRSVASALVQRVDVSDKPPSIVNRKPLTAAQSDGQPPPLGSTSRRCRVCP